MRKPGTTALLRRGKLQGKPLTVGLDLGDRSSFYCVLNGVGEVVVEAKVATNPEAMRKTFEKMPSIILCPETGVTSTGGVSGHLRHIVHHATPCSKGQVMQRGLLAMSM